MIRLRPAVLADLNEVEQLALESPAGITSLPVDREALFRKIEASCHALATEVQFHGEESYFFVLEDLAARQLLGVSGITASAGFNEPFYSYRNETLVHASPGLGIYHKVHALSLCHDLTGNTLLSSFFIRPTYRFTEASELLSRGRFLFMAQHPQRFGETVVSEMVGVTDSDGTSPFWESVGRHFFGMDYAAAEHYCGVHGRRFITELLPQHPIYVPLLSDAAQAAVGQVGEASAVPYDILVREGFETERYVDIFDGGPALQAPIRAIRTITQSRLVHASVGNVADDAPRWIVANPALERFAAVVTPGRLVDAQLSLPAAVLAALSVETGASLRIAPL